MKRKSGHAKPLLKSSRAATTRTQPSASACEMLETVLAAPPSALASFFRVGNTFRPPGFVLAGPSAWMLCSRVFARLSLRWFKHHFLPPCPWS